jgi:magnesium transporter
MKIIRVGETTWIDLSSPGPKEVKYLSSQYNFPSQLFADLLHPSHRPKLLAYGKLYLLILHFPLYSQNKKKVEPREIDFLLGPNFIITAYWHKFPPLKELEEKISSSSNSKKEFLGSSPPLILNSILSELYRFLFRELDHIQKDLVWIEDHLFSKIHKEMVKTISSVRNNIISFKHYLTQHDEILKELSEKYNAPLSGVSGHAQRAKKEPQAKAGLKNIQHQYQQIWKMLENHRETIGALHETHNSLLTTKMNEIVLFLAMITALAIPFGLIIGLFPAGPLKTLVGLPIALLLDLLLVTWLLKRQWL